MVYTLLDVKYEGDKVKLYYLSEVGKIEEYIDESDYYPYFYCLNEDKALEVARKLGCGITSVKKKELFSNEENEYKKVSGGEDTLFEAKKHFLKVWEDEFQTVEKYAFDKNIRFGEIYKDFGGSFHPGEVNLEIFNETFGNLAGSDPIRYNLAKKFFEIIEQPLPEITEDIAKYYRFDKTRMQQALYLSRITNSPITLRNAPPSYFIKALYYLYLKSEGYLIPTPEEFSRGEAPRGVYGKAALVMTPEKGIFLNTFALDYESLYPSCIDIYNLSHETVNCGHDICLSNKVPEEEHHVCTLRRGKYSTLIGTLKDLRIKYYKKKGKEGNANAKVISEVLKMILVICYGVTIRIKGLANPALAESITAYSRNALRTAWKFALEQDLKPVYGDTDSLFIVNPDRKQLQTLVDRVKNGLKLDLAVDKKYKVSVFSSAKKAYLGIFESGKIDPKGLMAFKSNTPTFVKNVLEETAMELSRINNQGDIANVRSIINKILEKREKDLLEKRFEIKDLEFNVILHKKPSEIAGSSVFAQTYQCAIQMIDSGINLRRGQVIAFVKVKAFNYRGKKFTVKPIDSVKKEEINIADYISNLYSMMGQILEPLGISKDGSDKAYDTLTKWFKDATN